jgi:hypothetical protein
MSYYTKPHADSRAYVLDVAGTSSGGIVPRATGRCKQSSFRLPDESVSRQHVKLVSDRRRCEYPTTDEHSRNGTNLNGEQLRWGVRTQLRSGAFLSFGNSVVVLLDPSTLRNLSALKG